MGLYQRQMSKQKKEKKEKKERKKENKKEHKPICNIWQEIETKIRSNDKKAT
mgnify:CR=1 FL=1